MCVYLCLYNVCIQGCLLIIMSYDCVCDLVLVYVLVIRNLLTHLYSYTHTLYTHILIHSSPIYSSLISYTPLPRIMFMCISGGSEAQGKAYTLYIYLYTTRPRTYRYHTHIHTDIIHTYIHIRAHTRIHIHSTYTHTHTQHTHTYIHSLLHFYFVNGISPI